MILRFSRKCPLVNSERCNDSSDRNFLLAVKKLQFKFYQIFTINLVRGNINRIVRGRITIEKQKGTEIMENKPAEYEPKDALRSRSHVPVLECTNQTIFNHQHDTGLNLFNQTNPRNRTFH